MLGGFSLSVKLKGFVLWTAAIFVFLIILITFIVPAAALLFCTLVLPDFDTSRIVEFSEDVSFIMGFISVVLAIFSIWQANKGNQEMEKFVNEMKILREKQTELLSTIRVAANISQGTTHAYNWKQDQSK